MQIGAIYQKSYDNKVEGQAGVHGMQFISHIKNALQYKKPSSWDIQPIQRLQMNLQVQMAIQPTIMGQVQMDARTISFSHWKRMVGHSYRNFERNTKTKEQRFFQEYPGHRASTTFNVSTASMVKAIQLNPSY